MRRVFRFIVRALVLVVVFLASALLAMRFAIHGRQTTIPKVVGLSRSQAERTLAASGLVLEEGEHYFSSDVPVGRIMSQAPAPGAMVRRGWRVRVADSLGPQRVVIPDLTGNSERAAEINIRRRGLELGSIATASIPDAPSDQIVAQSPAANAVNVSEPKISFLIAGQADRPSFVMPDLVGQNEDRVIDAIVNAGLRVAAIATQAAPAGQAATEAVPDGTRMVVRTVPAAGQRVFQGQGIRLEVTR
jgi:beta-lactam-binding protein with PASTA domain